MPFIDAIDLFNYWSELPTVTMMMQAYFGIEEQASANDPMAIAAAMRAMGGTGKAQKLSEAPALDQERFAALRKQLEEMKRISDGR